MNRISFNEALACLKEGKLIQVADETKSYFRLNNGNVIDEECTSYGSVLKFKASIEHLHRELGLSTDEELWSLFEETFTLKEIL